MRLMRFFGILAGVIALSTGMTVSQAQDDKDKWITIKGQVKLTKAPESKKVQVTADKQHCESKGGLVYEDIIVNAKTNGVKHVVVWLRPDSTDRKAPFPKEAINPALAKAAPKVIAVDQPCCQFIPRVVACRVGDSIDFKNSAPVNHNINYSADSESFNVNLPPNGTKKTEALQAQSTAITFKCDIHPWMQGRARVFDHPYFAITDDNGNFEIKDAPKEGKWRVVYWHEGGFHKGREGVLGFPLDGETKGNTLELKAIELELPK